jgi:hypothetical protein
MAEQGEVVWLDELEGYSPPGGTRAEPGVYKIQTPLRGLMGGPPFCRFLVLSCAVALQ